MALVPTLSVAENVMLNDMVMSAKGKPLMNWAQLRTDAKRVLEKLHIDVNVRTLVQDRLPRAEADGSHRPRHSQRM